MADVKEKTWNEWLFEVMTRRPKGNRYLDSERGMEVGKLCLQVEREALPWRRSDVDTFWLDVQLCTKYGLDDEQVRFVFELQPGIESYMEHGVERKAYGEMMRGLEKLRKHTEEEANHENAK